MKLSVNILTWNCYPQLRATLEILNNDLVDIEHEIIIVDNGSVDGCQNVATIKNKTNLGISIAKNQGIDASQGEYILLLDGDIVPVPNSIKMLMDWLEEHPKEYAIGFYPNKFNRQPNTESNQTHHEIACVNLWLPTKHTTAIVFYGMFRRTMFTGRNIRFDESGEYGKVGYGWEDTDFYRQMKAKNIIQWVAGMNTKSGKYYHAINSSIKQMGDEKYIRSSKARRQQYLEKWGGDA